MTEKKEGDDLKELLSEYADPEGEFAEQASTGSLENIASLANRQVELERQIESAKLAVTILTEQHRAVSQDALPEAMQAVGMEKFTLADGSEIELKKDVETSFVAAARDNGLAFAWLEEHGHGGIIKHNVTCAFGRDEGGEAQRLTEVLESNEFKFNEERNVHPQTLAAWGRQEAREGRTPPEEIFHTFNVRKAKIKVPRR